MAMLHVNNCNCCCLFPCVCEPFAFSLVFVHSQASLTPDGIKKAYKQQALKWYAVISTPCVNCYSDALLPAG